MYVSPKAYNIWDDMSAEFFLILQKSFTSRFYLLYSRKWRYGKFKGISTYLCQLNMQVRAKSAHGNYIRLRSTRLHIKNKDSTE